MPPDLLGAHQGPPEREPSPRPDPGTPSACGPRAPAPASGGTKDWELHTAPSLTDRIEIYKVNLKRILFLAAALYPELMPMLNGEWEFLAILIADLD